MNQISFTSDYLASLLTITKFRAALRLNFLSIAKANVTKITILDLNLFVTSAESTGRMISHSVALEGLKCLVYLNEMMSLRHYSLLSLEVLNLMKPNF